MHRRECRGKMKHIELHLAHLAGNHRCTLYGVEYQQPRRLSARHPLDQAIAVRERAARRYDTALAELPGVEPLAPPPGGVGNYYKYVVLLPPTVDRSQLKKRMQVEHEVTLSGEVYALPLHQQQLHPVIETNFLDGHMLRPKRHGQAKYQPNGGGSH